MTNQDYKKRIREIAMKIASQANSNGLQNKTLREYLKSDEFDQATSDLLTLLIEVRIDELEELQDEHEFFPPTYKELQDRLDHLRTQLSKEKKS